MFLRDRFSRLRTGKYQFRKLRKTQHQWLIQREAEWGTDDKLVNMNLNPRRSITTARFEEANDPI